MNAWFYFALFLMSANLVIMFILYLRIKERFSEKRILSDIRFEIDKLIIDLGRETDRSVAILEDRILATQQLIDKADKRILLADQETTKRMNQPQIPPHKTVQESSIQIEKPSVIPNKIQVNENVPIENRAEPVTIYTRPMITRREIQIEQEVPIKERVMEMARKDISPQMIATTLSVSLGEVELILNMNNSSL